MPNYYYNAWRPKFVTIALPKKGESVPELTARVVSEHRGVNRMGNGNHRHLPEYFEGATDPYEGMYR